MTGRSQQIIANFCQDCFDTVFCIWICVCPRLIAVIHLNSFALRIHLIRISLIFDCNYSLHPIYMLPWSWYTETRQFWIIQNGDTNSRLSKIVDNVTAPPPPQNDRWLCDAKGLQRVMPCLTHVDDVIKFKSEFKVIKIWLQFILIKTVFCLNWEGNPRIWFGLHQLLHSSGIEEHLLHSVHLECWFMEELSSVYTIINYNSFQNHLSLFVLLCTERTIVGKDFCPVVKNSSWNNVVTRYCLR